MDDLIDLAYQGISLAVREMCCRIATDSASFARAAANLNRSRRVHLARQRRAVARAMAQDRVMFETRFAITPAGVAALRAAEAATA